MELKPSDKQILFLKSNLDIVFYGGAAGGGKTYALLLNALYYINVNNFTGVFLRRTVPNITKAGGLWDTAVDLYKKFGGIPNKTLRTIIFPKSNAKFDFSYLARDDELSDWQGSQYALICFDELTEFTKKQFIYLLSRNRTLCGVKPTVRATCNPDANSWVREFIDYYIDKEGYISESKSDKKMYFINSNDNIYWYSNKDDAKKAFKTINPKSFTFIHANLFDNKVLMDSNPGYYDNLQALNRVDKQRLLYGNWNIKVSSGDYFRRTDFEYEEALPPLLFKVRAWDLASSEQSENNPDPDYTVGLLVGLDKEGVFHIIDMIRVRYRPSNVEKLVIQTSKVDGTSVFIHMPIDPGSAGRLVVNNFIKLLAGFPIITNKVTGSKESRARIASIQSGARNIKILKGNWNNIFLNELEDFPEGSHDDIVDCLSDSINFLGSRSKSKLLSNNNILSY